MTGHVRGQAGADSAHAEDHCLVRWHILSCSEYIFDHTPLFMSVLEEHLIFTSLPARR